MRSRHCNIGWLCVINWWHRVLEDKYSHGTIRYSELLCHSTTNDKSDTIDRNVHRRRACVWRLCERTMRCSCRDQIIGFMFLMPTSAAKWICARLHSDFGVIGQWRPKMWIIRSVICSQFGSSNTQRERKAILRSGQCVALSLDVCDSHDLAHQEMYAQT